MKSKLQLLMLLLTFAAFGVGCSGDIANFADGSQSVDPKSKGYLSFSGLSLTVEDLDELHTDVENDKVTLAATRSNGVDTDNFIVRVTRESTSEVVYNDIYSNISETPIRLNAGAYVVAVMSCEDEDIPAVGDNPTYKGSIRCVVGNEEKTYVGEIICSMSNVKTAVEMSKDLTDKFNPTPSDPANKLLITLEVGGEEYAFDPLVEEYKYFRAPVDGAINVYLSGMYNITPGSSTPTYFTISKGDWVETIKNVKAGQYRNVSVKIDHNTTGTIAIKLEIKTWGYDNVIDLDVTAPQFLSCAFAEDVIVDPESGASDFDSPEVTLEGGLDVEAVYTVSGAIFDTDTKTYSPTYKANVTPLAGSTVKEISIEVKSTAAGLSSILSGAGFDDNGAMVIYSTQTAVSAALSDYISVRKDSYSDKMIVAATYDGMFELSKYVGEHTITIIATDSEDRTSYTHLNLETIFSGGPDIEWLGGYDFDTTYNIYTDSEIAAGEGVNPVVTIAMTSNSPEGLTALTLYIDSEVLPKELLESVGLSDEMDLVNAEGELKAALSEMFPVGDEIKGKSYVELSISELIELLALQGAGESVFTILAGDATGTNGKIVKLVKE